MSEPIELRLLGSSAPRLPPRHPDTKSGGLGSAYRAAEDKARAAVHLQEGGLDSVSVWGCGVASWYTLLAIPLLLFPRILLFFAQVPPPPSTYTTKSAPASEHYDALTPLESFLCLSLSLGLLSMAMITLFVLVPSYTAPGANPSRTPLLAILVGLMTIVAVVSINTGSIGGLGKVVGGGHIIMAIWGWWVVVFGNGRGKLTTKGKKHTPERFKRL